MVLRDTDVVYKETMSNAKWYPKIPMWYTKGWYIKTECIQRRVVYGVYTKNSEWYTEQAKLKVKHKHKHTVDTN